MDRRLTGAYGELYTGRYLRDNSCNILAANYRCRMGEIDIVASDKKYIMFVEVKTRDENRIATAREAVDTVKQRKIIAAANYYLSKRQIKLQPRFDVAEVYISNEEVSSFNYIKNAYGDL